MFSPLPQATVLGSPTLSHLCILVRPGKIKVRASSDHCSKFAGLLPMIAKQNVPFFKKEKCCFLKVPKFVADEASHRGMSSRRSASPGCYSVRLGSNNELLSSLLCLFFISSVRTHPLSL